MISAGGATIAAIGTLVAVCAIMWLVARVVLKFAAQTVDDERRCFAKSDERFRMSSPSDFAWGDWPNVPSDFKVSHSRGSKL